MLPQSMFQIHQYSPAHSAPSWWTMRCGQTSWQRLPGGLARPVRALTGGVAHEGRGPEAEAVA
jgi:hypothetical protein